MFIITEMLMRSEDATWESDPCCVYHL